MAVVGLPGVVGVAGVAGVGAGVAPWVAGSPTGSRWGERSGMPSRPKSLSAAFSTSAG